MNIPTYDKGITALLVVDPYNDFISEGGKIWLEVIDDHRLEDRAIVFGRVARARGTPCAPTSSTLREIAATF